MNKLEKMIYGDELHLDNDNAHKLRYELLQTIREFTPIYKETI